MKIHSDTLSAMHIVNALHDEQAAGRIPRHVQFKALLRVGSRSHKHAFEVQLESSEPGNGRRAGNSGSYGAMRPDVDGYAATYDEWGWLLAAIYAKDPHAVCGSVKHPNYGSAADFHDKTGWSYNTAALLAALEQVGGDPYPFVTTRTNRIGRRGAGRASYWELADRRQERAASAAIEWAARGNTTTESNNWCKFAPRTAEWVTAFGKGETK